MIVEQTLEFEPEKLPFSVNEVENFIKKNGIEPIRWAITRKSGSKFLINVSGIKH